MVTVDPIGDVIKAVELFVEVALTDPLTAVLVAIGGLLTTVAMAALAGLSTGGAVTFFLRLLERPDQPD